MKRLLLLMAIATVAAHAAYFPQTSLIQGGLVLSQSNPIPFRLSDGTNFISTLPVSVSGGATAANQVTANGSLASIDTKLTSPLAVTGAFYQATQPVSGTFWQATQPVSAASLPLPTGAATETTLSSINTKIPSLISGKSPVALFDGAGNALTSIDDGNGGKAIEVTLAATNFVLSTANSTTTQLAASATFTGAIETIFNQQAISILLTSDKAGTLTLNQYIDAAGTRKINSWVYSIAANVPFSRSFTGNGNYFNLSFQNSAGASTTTLNINTAYGTLPATSNLGNGPVSLDEMNGVTLSVGRKDQSLSIPVTLPSANVYSATASNIVPALLATDVFTITGSATKTIRITKIRVAGIQSTSGTELFSLIKRSTADTGGTSATITNVPHDSASPAATAVVKSYSANPTLGTTVGSIITLRKEIVTANFSNSDYEPTEYKFGDGFSQPITLRGTSEQLAFNVNGITLGGASLSVDVEWIEE